jgi:hypothetical protein
MFRRFAMIACSIFVACSTANQLSPIAFGEDAHPASQPATAASNSDHESAQLHALLKARDAEFDNLTVAFELTSIEMIDIRDFLYRIAKAKLKMGLRFEPPAEEEVDKPLVQNRPVVPREPYEGKVVKNCEMTVRGPAFTLRWDESDPRTQFLVLAGCSQANQVIYSTTTGILRSAHSSYGTTWSLTKTTIQPNDAVVELRRDYTWVCGIGFGELIQKVDSTAYANDGVATIKGTGKAYGTTDARFTVQVDKDHVVQSAIVQIDYPWQPHRLEMSTNGKLNSLSQLSIPQTASWKRVIISRDSETGKVSERVAENFRFKFKSIKTKLSDAEYEQASAFPEEFQNVAELNPAAK